MVSSKDPYVFPFLLYLHISSQALLEYPTGSLLFCYLFHLFFTKILCSFSNSSIHDKDAEAQFAKSLESGLGHRSIYNYNIGQKFDQLDKFENLRQTEIFIENEIAFTFFALTQC